MSQEIKRSNRRARGTFTFGKKKIERNFIVMQYTLVFLSKDYIQQNVHDVIQTK